jgi:hypothetical protein
MRWMALVLAVAALLVSGTLLDAAPAADSTPVFAFSDSGLNLTCADLVKGHKVAITNATGSTQSLHLKLRPTSGKLKSQCGGVSVENVPSKVAPGDTVTATLRGAKPAVVKTPVEGSIVAYGSGGSVATLPLALVTSAESGPARPLISSVSGTKYRQTTATPIWIPVDLGAKKKVTFKPGDVLGAVSSGGDRGAVTFVTQKRMHGVAVVGLNVPRLAAGTYSGSVDLLPTVDGKGDVALTVAVKDSWPIVLIVLLASLFFAFLVQRVTGVYIPRYKLNTTADGVSKTYQVTRTALANAPESGAWKSSTLTDLNDSINKVKADIADQLRGAIVSVDSKITTSLAAAVKALDDTVKTLGDLAKTEPALAQALASYDAGQITLPALVGITASEPLLVQEARAQLLAQQVTVAGLAEALANVVATAQHVSTLAKRRAYIGALYKDILTLQDECAGDTTKLALVNEQLRELTSVWRQLFTTDDPARLDELLSQLHAIDNALGALWPTVKERMSLQPMLELGTREMLEELLPDRGIQLDVGPRPVDPHLAAARHSAAMARWLALFALAVALVVAVVAAFGTLYIGKPFGSFWDYVVLVTWGLATPPALAAAATALDNVGALTALGRRFSA